MEEERTQELSELVQIEDHIHKNPSQLSGGQQQHVAIARALAKELSILLMDEPLSNLDARLRIEMREEIRRIQQTTGVITVFVTQDQEEALSISDEVMVLNDGVIQQYSDPVTLYKKPVNKFVARFLGTPVINMIGVTPEQLTASYLTIPEKVIEEVVEVGVRAEDFHATNDASQALFTGTVTHVERVGKDTTVHICQGEQSVVATDLEIIPQEEGEIHLTASIEDIHLFDEDGNVLNREESSDNYKESDELEAVSAHASETNR